MIQVIKDIEEALKREIAKITSHYPSTKGKKIIDSTYDVFTGQPLTQPIKAHFYDENSIPNNVLYPRVDITFEEILEDRTSGRMLSIWEDYDNSYRQLIDVNKNRPQMYKPVAKGMATVEPDGLVVSPINLAKAKVGYKVRINTGANKGIYVVKSINTSLTKIELDNEIVAEITEISYNDKLKSVFLLNPTPLYAVKAGDTFIDASDDEYTITYVDVNQRELRLTPSTMPDLAVGAKIVRLAGALNNVDTEEVSYTLMDTDQPLTSAAYPSYYLTDEYHSSHYMTPFNYYWSVEITNKERPFHVAMAERMTETVINRPRRAIELLLRTEDSADYKVTVGPNISNRNTVTVEDSSHYRVNDSVYLVNETNISENNQIIDIDYDTDTITLRYNIPLEFQPQNKTSLVSNACVKYWTMMLENEVLLGRDDMNSFFRQEYVFKIEGWKDEKSGQLTTKGISDIEVKIEANNKAECTLKV